MNRDIASRHDPAQRAGLQIVANTRLSEPGYESGRVWPGLAEPGLSVSSGIASRQGPAQRAGLQIVANTRLSEPGYRAAAVAGLAEPGLSVSRGIASRHDPAQRAGLQIVAKPGSASRATGWPL